MRSLLIGLGLSTAVVLATMAVRTWTDRPGIWSASVGPGELSEQARSAHLEEFHGQLLRSRQQADAIADDLIDGNISLAVATERVAEVNAFRSNTLVNTLRRYRHLANASEREIYARYILQKVRDRPGFDRALQPELVRQLTAEFRALTGADDDPLESLGPAPPEESGPGKTKCK